MCLSKMHPNDNVFQLSSILYAVKGHALPRPAAQAVMRWTRSMLNYMEIMTHIAFGRCYPMNNM